MEWVKNCNIIIDPRLVHNKVYMVKLESGREVYARFWVYQGGEEVAFLSSDGKRELSVAEIYI